MTPAQLEILRAIRQDKAGAILSKKSGPRLLRKTEGYWQWDPSKLCGRSLTREGEQALRAAGDNF